MIIGTHPFFYICHLVNNRVRPYLTLLTYVVVPDEDAEKEGYFKQAGLIPNT